jgi:hypothetical protein
MPSFGRRERGLLLFVLLPSVSLSLQVFHSLALLMLALARHF